MMKFVLSLLSTMLLLSCLAVTQSQSSSGTINTMTTNPRQNQELTNTTGTETGQPSDAVPGSEAQDNGLITPTTNMVGSGSNGNVSQPTPGSHPPAPDAAEQTTPNNPSADAGTKNASKGETKR
jgi:hypothetical protein